MRTVLFAALLAGPAWALGPLEKNDDDVAAGMEAYQKGDFTAAVEAFDRALKRTPAEPRVHFNRGVALLKAGQPDEAEKALRRAEELDAQGTLRNKILYNLGNLEAGRGQKEVAVQRYRQALRVDPKDTLSRHNLEVLLKDLPPPKKSGPDGGVGDGGTDGGQPDGGPPQQDGGADAGRPDGGTDGGQGDAGPPDAGADAGQGDGGRPDGGAGDGGAGRDAGQGDGGQGDAGTSADGGESSDAGQAGQAADGGQGSDGGASFLDAGQAQQARPVRDGGMTPEEARSLLESLKNSEKNLQLWRFKQKTQRKNPDGKDW